jgi:hypothetical protein
MTIQSAERSLLALVEAERDRQRDALIETAREQAAATIARAHAEAREAMRRTFADSRERHAARVATATAELATRERIAEQHRVAALLAEAWQRLPDELVRRWRDPALRAQWVAHVVARARALLPRGAWRIVHAPDWPDDERDALARSLEAPVEFVADPSHRAGLAVASSANFVDGTLEGLVYDRDEIGAQLLCELQRANEEALA